MTATAAAAPPATRTRWGPPRTSVAALGVVYLAVGAVGAVLTGWSDPTSPHGAHLLVFRVNPMHNAAHLGLGAALLVGALAGLDAARGTARLVGVVFLLLGAVGPFVMGTHVDPIALNGWDHLLHLGTAAILLWAAWVLRERRSA